MEREGMWIDYERFEEQLQAFARLPVRGQVTCQREPGSPFLRRRGNQPTAQGREPRQVVHLRVGRLEPRKSQVRALRSGPDEAFPGRDRCDDVPLRELNISEIQIRGSVLRVQL